MPDAALTNSVLDLFRLDGRRALVTGGSKGIGRVVAEALAQAGAEIVVVSRTLADCQRAAAEIGEKTSRRTWAFAADVAAAEQVDRLAETVAKEAGNIDILVNSAGLNIRGAVQDLTVADWDAVLNINLRAPFLMARRFGPPMAQRGWGRILHLGSVLSAIGLPQRSPYASSKAGILGLTRTLAMDWAAQGVTVNALCPGIFATEMNKPIMDNPALHAQFVAKVPIGRWGELHELTGAALFLVSNAASYVTGTTLFVDGGWTVQ